MQRFQVLEDANLSEGTIMFFGRPVQGTLYMHRNILQKVHSVHYCIGL